MKKIVLLFLGFLVSALGFALDADPRGRVLASAEMPVQSEIPFHSWPGVLVKLVQSPESTSGYVLEVKKIAMGPLPPPTSKALRKQQKPDSYHVEQLREEDGSIHYQDTEKKVSLVDLREVSGHTGPQWTFTRNGMTYHTDKVLEGDLEENEN